MATDVVMPQMGESIAEGTITKWLVKVGDQIERDKPLFEISTDKVDAEIPSPASGTLLEIRNQEGETVPVNQVVAVIGEAGEQPGAAAPAASSREAEPPPPPPSVDQVAAGTGRVETPDEVKRMEEARADIKDAGPEGEPKVASPEPAPQPAQPAPAAEPAKAADEATDEATEATDEGNRLRKFSSPLVRNIAAKEGVNLEEVQGTGPCARSGSRSSPGSGPRSASGGSPCGTSGGGRTASGPGRVPRGRVPG